MGNLHKELTKCKHPNSRKTKQLAKKAKRMNNKHKSRLGHAIKSNILGEKLSWFLNHMGERENPLSPDEFENLIELYLKRFNNELEQIKIKQGISKHRNNQHIARENVIIFTLERENAEWNGGGMELLNLCDSDKFKAMQKWDGNAINVQHFKLDLISKKFIQDLRNSTNSEEINFSKPTIIVTPTSSDDERMC